MSGYYLNLFSNNTSSNSTSNSTYDFFNNIGQHASIRNGSYGKLLRSYYKADSSSNSDSSSALNSILNSNSSTVASTTAKEVKEATDNLKKSALALSTSGSKSLFEKKDVTVTDEKTGEKTTTKQYDTDAIVKAVKAFAKDYNDTLSSVSDVTNKNVSRSLSYMTKQTKIYENSLSKLGITVDSDNKLTIDEEKLKKADMNTVKSLFNGSYSFASQVSQKASQLQQTTATASNNSYLYNKSGSYNFNNYSSSYSSYF
ncbi:flagellar filament capping protein FliD [Anaerosporobacter sp.]|uniref:flagellar filament capping protein FliD n=1 Tax=Anaerosporobacter sp. TaxID=1872529 RepID=UPI00286F8C36|nr:flagellar filament capping protein FliD [Anaerosporobacter sp.]